MGRLNWAKGYDLLIESLSVLKNHPNFQMKIAGDGPYRSKLENMIDHYSLRDNVFILGELHYNDILNFMIQLIYTLNPQFLKHYQLLYRKQWLPLSQFLHQTLEESRSN